VGNHILITPIDKCIWWGNTRKKWCFFFCRKHLVHHKITITWGGDTGMYYEPFHELCCFNCGQDHTRMLWQQ